MESQTFEQAVKKTVKWWSEKAFSTPLNQNNGDNSDTGSLAFMLMNIISMDAQKEVSKESIERFESKLSELLLAQKGRDICLHVDYNPDEMLYEACKAAGVSTSLLPCKTTSWIGVDNSVRAKYQYGGPVRMI